MNAVQLIAATLYLECANQGEYGIHGVASVIWNSTEHHAPTELTAECLKPRRYSCWNLRRPDVDVISQEILLGPYNKIPEIVKDAWQVCWTMAALMVNGKFTPSVDATNYYRFDIPKPEWTNNCDRVCQIGQHIFWKARS